MKYLLFFLFACAVTIAFFYFVHDFSISIAIGMVLLLLAAFMVEAVLYGYFSDKYSNNEKL